MSGEENIEIIKAVYEAFGRGDVGQILNSVTDDVDWATDTSSRVAPWYGPHKGKSGVTHFFEAFGSSMTVQQFEPISFSANDTEVHTIVRLKATRIASGRRAEMNLHHWFQFRDGKISFYRGSEDTSQSEAIFSD
jgi:uncharacterized protein